MSGWETVHSATDIYSNVPYGSYLRHFNTESAQNEILGDFADAYRTGKSYLPYLGAPGIKAWTGLTALEVGATGYLKGKELYNSFQNNSAAGYLEDLVLE